MQNNKRKIKEDLIFNQYPPQPERRTAPVRTRTSKRRETSRRRRARRRRRFRLFLILVLMLLLSGSILKIRQKGTGLIGEGNISSVIEMFDTPVRMKDRPELTEEYLTPNEFSRPGDKLGKVKNIFVHYTANPGTNAMQNRSYFENLKDTGERSASAHFIIGYAGEIVQCIPLEEQAYAVAGRNQDSVSIECCYVEENGHFTQETYDSLVKLSAWLLGEYRLDASDLLRHYDSSGKQCPLYYVEHEDAWEQFVQDVDDYIKTYGVKGG